jgi:hypothetical protein
LYCPLLPLQACYRIKNWGVTTPLKKVMKYIK